MSIDIDFAPLYDKITKPPDKDTPKDQGYFMSDVYRDWLATFVQTLSTYLTSGGIFLPQLTTAQRNALQNPINGQMIYNTTLGSAQYFKAGTWTSF
jgi:hypothetical protein